MVYIPVQVQGQEKPHIPAQQSSQVPLTQPFCSIQVFSGLDEAHPHQGGQPASLCLPIQMLTSPRNTLTETPRITFGQLFGYPVAQSG